MAISSNSFGKLSELIKLERKEISSIYFFAILNGLVQLSLPLGIQAIIGFVLGATMVTSVYVLIFFVVLGTLVVGILNIYQMKIIEKIQQKIFVRYTFNMGLKIPGFDLLSIDKYYLPDKINYFFDILTVQKGISKLLLDIPIATIQIILGLVLLSFYHPLFIVFGFLLLLILFLLLRFTSKSGLDTSISESNHKYTVAAWLQETGRVIKAFKLNPQTHLNLIKTDNKVLDYLVARTSHFRILLFQYRSIVFFKVGITALMLIIGTYLLFNQLLNIGEFVAVELVIITVIGSLEKLIISLENIYDVSTGLLKIDSVLNNPSDISGTIKFAANQDIELKFHEVSFSYEPHNPVFKQVNFQISAQSLTGISGEDGSGKTTLLKLISGLYKKFSGFILVNGIPIQNYDLENYRSHIGVYLQENDLFEGTAYENISMGRPVEINQIMSLSKQLGIDDFINSLPQAFETILDPQGVKLPSTVGKKILLLRALLSNPSLVILEEPWFGLEYRSTETIKKYLIELAKFKTVIVATNDIEFLRQCHQNLKIEKGYIQ
ncbi:MAG: ABC transporter ATP-binding protein [Saprospiraceae bacterium]|jgi:ABC-type bacteriocin/lantibiotic exporter with double-glycine peptidase domain|nr:ABC transporter ATP-binding protein [Saprospiraceae bacterium]MBK7372812.1 ABC transporter ATP-binding protein [Saprospiraceae bacterium]